MKQLLTCVICAFCVTLTASSQNQLLSKINEIKAQNDIFFWNEYSHADADSAFVNACRWMLVDINMGRKESLSIESILPYIKRITMTRGNMVRAFAFVKKSDIPADGGGTSTATMTTQVMTSDRQLTPDIFVQSILQKKDFYSVYKFLEDQRIQGHLLQYGPLKDVEDYASLELILFDMQSKEVVSILSPVTQGTTRTNLLTGGTDSLDNYPEDMTLVIWYIRQ